VLRKIFVHKREELPGDRRNLHNEELHDLCSSPNIISVIKSRRMRWEERMAFMGDRTYTCRVLMEKPE
jgi:hypothetical protein